MAATVKPFFSKGTKVEVTSNEDGFRDSWYPATIIEQPSKKRKRSKNEGFWVEFDTLFVSEDEGSDHLIHFVEVEFIRPSPPPPPPTCNDDHHHYYHFKINDVVDAFYNDGWWTGTIVDEDEGGGGGCSRFVVLFTEPPVKMSFYPSELRIHLHWNGVEWLHPHKKEDIRARKNCQRKPKLNSLKVNGVALDNDHRKLPFRKSSALWETVECFDVFKGMPRKPHFSPLEKYEEFSREMLAINKMVTFAYVAERISKFPADATIVHHNLEILKDLELHGFDVTEIRNRMATQLAENDNEIQLQDERGELENDSNLCNIEKSKAEEVRVFNKLVEDKIHIEELPPEIIVMDDKIIEADTLQSDQNAQVSFESRASSTRTTVARESESTKIDTRGTSNLAPASATKDILGKEVSTKEQPENRTQEDMQALNNHRDDGTISEKRKDEVPALAREKRKLHKGKNLDDAEIPDPNVKNKLEKSTCLKFSDVSSTSAATASTLSANCRGTKRCNNGLDTNEKISYKLKVINDETGIVVDSRFAETPTPATPKPSTPKRVTESLHEKSKTAPTNEVEQATEFLNKISDFDGKKNTYKFPDSGKSSCKRGLNFSAESYRKDEKCVEESYGQFTSLKVYRRRKSQHIKYIKDLVPFFDLLKIRSIIRKRRTAAINGTSQLVENRDHQEQVRKKRKADQASKTHVTAKIVSEKTMMKEWIENSCDEDAGVSSDRDESKWWESQRELFHGLVMSFISRVQLIQGDRKFSPWKGSVVDSVVGAFLTQNVSDTLSSSAFISLAAQYPCKVGGDKSPAENFVHIVSTSTSAVNEGPEGRLGSEVIEKKLHVKNRKRKKGKKNKNFEMKKKKVNEESNSFNWDDLKKLYSKNQEVMETCGKTSDALDWYAVMSAQVDEVSRAIEERGMNNKLALRIKNFLKRIASEHGHIDLEWLRHIPHEKAKEYLLSIEGLGVKSVECVRLLTLQQQAFPVDRNVARVAVRLGWVPVQLYPEGSQMHRLKEYPPFNSIQHYLWKRLSTLDQATLCKLHYLMITFGKVFCTKTSPNCNACPMRSECKHFASRFTSSGRLVPNKNMDAEILSLPQPRITESGDVTGKCQNSDIVEISRALERTRLQEKDIEDLCSSEMPSIELNIKAFVENLQYYTDVEHHISLKREASAFTSDDVIIPVSKSKTVRHSRTEHHVYELPDSHPLLIGLEKRLPDDPCLYLLAIWAPDYCKPEKLSTRGSSDGSNVREEDHGKLRGSLLVPCWTAMNGRFPLDGTYFQVNEVFADHESSLNPFVIPRPWLQNLEKRMVHCATSVRLIYKDLSTEEVQHRFWKDFVCVKGFDRKQRAPKPLPARFRPQPTPVKSTRGMRKKKEKGEGHSGL